MADDRTVPNGNPLPPPDVVPVPSVTSAATPPTLIILRTLAIAGTLLALAVQAGELTNLKPRQGYGIVLFILEALTIGVVMLTMLTVAGRRLVRHPDLLLPLGLFVAFDFGLASLARLPALAAVLLPTWEIKILSISYTLSVMFALQILLALVYAGWTTTMVWQAVLFNRVEPLKAFAAFGRWIGRTMLVETIGWGVIFLGAGVLLTGGIAAGEPFFYFALFFMACFSLIWNFFTCGLLLTCLHPDRRSDLGLIAGLAASQRALGRCWWIVLCQLILLGWITWLSITYTDSPRPGTVTTHNSYDFTVHTFWTGAYDNDCRWHSKLMAMVKTDRLQVISSLLALLLGVLAVAIKLHVAAAMHRRPPPPRVDWVQEVDELSYNS